jgi:hypothetical protein
VLGVQVQTYRRLAGGRPAGEPHRDRPFRSPT